MPASAIFTRTCSYESRSEIGVLISVCRSPGICSEPGREERKPGWAIRLKPQTGLTVRLRPGEAFARSKSARVCAFCAHGQTLDRPAETHPCSLSTPDLGQMDMAARRR